MNNFQTKSRIYLKWQWKEKLHTIVDVQSNTKPSSVITEHNAEKNSSVKVFTEIGVFTFVCKQATSSIITDKTDYILAYILSLPLTSPLHATHTQLALSKA